MRFCITIDNNRFFSSQSNAKNKYRKVFKMKCWSDILGRYKSHARPVSK